MKILYVLFPINWIKNIWQKLVVEQNRWTSLV